MVSFPSIPAALSTLGNRIIGLAAPEPVVLQCVNGLTIEDWHWRCFSFLPPNSQFRPAHRLHYPFRNWIALV